MTLDPNTGTGAWTPAATDAAATTTVVVSATNSAGTSLLTFTFPTYFTTAPTNVADAFYTNTSKSAPPPTITWTAPANSGSVADYKLAVTDANTNATTVYDTGSTATSYTLSSVSALQNFVTVTAYDAHGNPSMASSAISFEVAAMQSLGWTFSSPNAIVGQAFSVPFSPASPYYSYSIASGPSGASINATTGLLIWTPTLADVGTANIVVAASNGWGTVYATLSFPVYVTGPGSAVTLTPADWSSDGFTLTQGSDGNVHVYLTGTTTDVVSPITPASLTSISISAPNSAATLTIDSSNGNPIPAGGLTFSGPGGLIKTGSGVVILSGSNTYTDGTTVADGTLLVSNSGALPTTGGVTVGANGILENGGGAANTTVESISGAGGAVIDAGSDLTANSINLGSLVIGGTADNPAIVTIAASDASGNPLTAPAASQTSGTAFAIAGTANSEPALAPGPAANLPPSDSQLRQNNAISTAGVSGTSVALATLFGGPGLESTPGVQPAAACLPSDSTGSRPIPMGNLALLDATFGSGLGGLRDDHQSEWLGAEVQSSGDESLAAGPTHELLELLAAGLGRSHLAV